MFCATSSNHVFGRWNRISHSEVVKNFLVSPVQWNLVSNKIQYNLLRCHFVVVKCAVDRCWQVVSRMGDNKDSLNETKRISTKTLLNCDAHEWNQTLCNINHLSLEPKILNNINGWLNSNHYDSLTCTCYSWDQWHDGRKDVFSHKQTFFRRPGCTCEDLWRWSHYH